MINTDQIDTLLSHLFLQSTTPPPPPSPPPPSQNPHPTQPEPLRCLANLPEQPTKDELGHFFGHNYQQQLQNTTDASLWLQDVTTIDTYQNASASMLLRGKLIEFWKGNHFRTNEHVVLKIFEDNESNIPLKYELDIHSCVIASFHSELFAHPLAVFYKKLRFLQKISFHNSRYINNWDTKIGIIVMEDCGNIKLFGFLEKDKLLTEEIRSVLKLRMWNLSRHWNKNKFEANRKEIKNLQHKLNSRSHVILQMITALRFMAKNEIVHNDLHFGNVFVKDMDNFHINLTKAKITEAPVKSKTTNYRNSLEQGLDDLDDDQEQDAGDDIIEMNRLVKIYDWDHAHSSKVPEDDETTVSKTRDPTHYGMYKYTNGNNIYDQIAFLKGISEYEEEWSNKNTSMDELRKKYGWVLQWHETARFYGWDANGDAKYYKYQQTTCDGLVKADDQTKNKYTNKKVECRKIWEDKQDIETLVLAAIDSLYTVCKDRLV